MINFRIVVEDIVKKRHDSKVYCEKTASAKNDQSRSAASITLSHHPVIAENHESMEK